VDNDGFITRDEMYNIVDAIYQMVVSILRQKMFVLILCVAGPAAVRGREHAPEASRQDLRPDGQEPRRPPHLGGVPGGQQGGSEDCAGADSGSRIA
jgi:hypothetical protein